MKRYFSFPVFPYVNFANCQLHIAYSILFVIFFLPTVFTNAQPKHKIAIFAPLYLDSAFDQVNNYRYGKQFPKYINPGLEFVEGAQLAFDSLARENDSLEVFIYDTRSVKENISQQLQKPEIADAELIFGFANPQESWALATAAQSRKIPYINVNLPNDAGITNNPYVVLLNSTLKTHVDKIYLHLQKYYSLNSIVVFRKKGQMEDMIKSYLDSNSLKNRTFALSIKYVDLNDSFNVNQLKAHLDSNRHFVCVAGSLDENFGRRLATQLASLTPSYELSLIGMPTFDNFSKEFLRPEFHRLEIVYSTPFYNNRLDNVSLAISNYFNTKMFARPSDMVLRGYEASWRFSKLLLKYKQDVTSNLSRKEFNLFRELDIQPVINKQTNTTDYFENKKLFFLRIKGGVLNGVF
jgi:hypothetical protein